MSAIFVTIATEKVKQVPEFYTWTIFLINQLGEIHVKQLSVFVPEGAKLPLYARTPLYCFYFCNNLISLGIVKIQMTSHTDNNASHFWLPKHV